MIPLCRPFLSEDAIDAVTQCLRSGWWGYGEICHSLEHKFITAHGGWALATSSCTSALYIAARILKKGPSDEVIVPALTFMSTPMSFHEAGYCVRIADVDPEHLTLSLEAVKALVTPNTRAVVLVDLYGQKSVTPEIVDFCRSKRIALVEDRAHRVDLADPPSGVFACFSFNAVKEAPGGEGGLLLGRSSDDEALARAISNVGLGVDTLQRSSAALHLNYRFSHESGLKLRLSDISASLVLSALLHQEEHYQKRQQIFLRYDAGLRSLRPWVTPIARTTRDSFLMYVVRLRGIDRNRLREDLSREGIATSIHYPPVTQHPIFAEQAVACPNAAEIAQEIVTLPCFPNLSSADQDQVMDSILASVRNQVNV